jgi:hypothetical protein
LRKAGVKFTAALLVEVALDILRSPGSLFGLEYRDPRNDQLIWTKINTQWVQSFIEHNNIVLFRQTGIMICSKEKELQIERLTAFHLGELKRGFESGLYYEDYMKNVDETHFVINFHNGRTLGFRGDVEKKYADVVIGGQSMTMVVRIIGGRRARLAATFMIFENSSRTYPIRNVPDNIPGVSYYTSPKDWMDKYIFAEYFIDE